MIGSSGMIFIEIKTYSTKILTTSMDQTAPNPIVTFHPVQLAIELPRYPEILCLVHFTCVVSSTFYLCCV